MGKRRSGVVGIVAAGIFALAACSTPTKGVSADYVGRLLKEGETAAGVVKVVAAKITGDQMTITLKNLSTNTVTVSYQVYASADGMSVPIAPAISRTCAIAAGSEERASATVRSESGRQPAAVIQILSLEESK